MPKYTPKTPAATAQTDPVARESGPGGPGRVRRNDRAITQRTTGRVLTKCAILQPDASATYSNVAAASSIGGFPCRIDGRMYRTTPESMSTPAARGAALSLL